MEAIIIKNDQFETIGFDVLVGNSSLYCNGISGSSPFYYKKKIEISSAVEFQKVFRLIELKTLIYTHGHDFTIKFFEISTQNKIVLPEKGVNLSVLDTLTKQYKAEERKIIDSFK